MTRRSGAVLVALYLAALNWAALNWAGCAGGASLSLPAIPLPAPTEAPEPVDARIPEGAEAPLFDDLGDHHVPVATPSSLAQKFFNQGLTLAYGFNHLEAARSFREAARLDPGCAMCWWGVAYALGPNINKPMDPGDNAEAYAASRKALVAAGETPAHERALVEAMAARYAAEPPADRSALDLAYAERMAASADGFPDNDDVLTLYAEALMDTMPWDYYTDPHTPKPEGALLLDALERVIARDPDHPGALHLYIHATEPSATPERAEAAADRLLTLVPGAGHLVHMPSHTYLRIGRYGDAIAANELASRADESYITQCKAQGFYPLLYYPHNVHFLWAAALFDGQAALALSSSRKLTEDTPAASCHQFPFLEEFRPAPYYTMVRFAMWNAMLAEPAPAAEFRYTTAIWHWARGTAMVAREDLDGAERELARVRAIAAEDGIAELSLLSGSTAAKVLAIAEATLDGDLLAARGETTDALARYRDAVASEDALPYSEPPPWPIPARHTLGHALLESGRTRDAIRVYEQDLAKWRHNGWALTGLERAHRRAGNDDAAARTAAHRTAAWVRADHTPSSSRW